MRFLLCFLFALTCRADIIRLTIEGRYFRYGENYEFFDEPGAGECCDHPTPYKLVFEYDDSVEAEEIENGVAEYIFPDCWIDLKFGSALSSGEGDWHFRAKGTQVNVYSNGSNSNGVPGFYGFTFGSAFEFEAYGLFFEEYYALYGSALVTGEWPIAPNTDLHWVYDNRNYPGLWASSYFLIRGFLDYPDVNSIVRYQDVFLDDITWEVLP